MPDQRALQVETAERRLPIVQLRQSIPNLPHGGTSSPLGSRKLSPDLSL
jgi:hypothetical protein